MNILHVEFNRRSFRRFSEPRVRVLPFPGLKEYGIVTPSQFRAFHHRSLIVFGIDLPSFFAFGNKQSKSCIKCRNRATTPRLVRRSVFSFLLIPVCSGSTPFFAGLNRAPFSTTVPNCPWYPSSDLIFQNRTPHRRLPRARLSFCRRVFASSSVVPLGFCSLRRPERGARAALACASCSSSFAAGIERQSKRARATRREKVNVFSFWRRSLIFVVPTTHETITT